MYDLVLAPGAWRKMTKKLAGRVLWWTWHGYRLASIFGILNGPNTRLVSYTSAGTCR